VFTFEGPIRKAIHGLKYENLTGISGFLTDFMAEYYNRYGLEGDVLVPVPLHERRMRQRGYNQSELMARDLSVKIAKPVNSTLLKRIRDALPQARTAHAAGRFDNVRGAFGCEAHLIKDMKVILIDDVCTSGATLEACAAVLKASGATQVSGFTLAREI
jgi:ComF family protein